MDNLAPDGPDRKAAALALAAAGFWLLPVKAGEKRPDPLLAPEGFKNASRDPEIIGSWFDLRPRANVGVACGADYGLLVLDVDVRPQVDGWASFREIFDGTLTRTAETPSGGAHFYFRHPGGTLPAHLEGLPGIDIKGAAGGGYVLAPPSRLPAGGYRWKDAEVPVAELSPELRQRLQGKPAPRQATAMSGPVATLTVPEGQRHSRLVELGAVYRGKGLQPDEIEALLWDHARRFFSPPFETDNLEHGREIAAVAHWYGGKPAKDTARPLVVLSTTELRARAREAPTRMLLDPILPEAGNLMVYGPTGGGKSHLGLSLAIALAEGGALLDWQATGPVPVLYVDGEMPLTELDARIAGYLAGRADPVNLHWLAARAAAEDLPDLASPAGQAAYLAAVSQCQAQVVVFDNLSCLRETTKDLPENGVEAWFPVAAFLRRLNGHGVATVVVHHSAKARTQRGSSAHTACMDTVIAMWPPGTGQEEPTAALDVEIVFEKHRRFGGEAAMPIRARVFEDADGHARWERAGEDPLAEDVARLRRQGQSIRDIALATRRAKSAIQKALQRAKARGLLAPGEAAADE